MPASALLTDLTRAGFTIQADGGRLVVGPASKLTDETRQVIRLHKAELLAEITARVSSPKLLTGAEDAHRNGVSAFEKSEHLRAERDRYEERTATTELREPPHASPLAQWRAGIARLSPASPPVGFTPRRWAEVLADANRFLARWGGQAEALGWETLDLFAVDPRAPDARYDSMGLVVVLDGSEVIAIAPDQAKVRTSTGKVQTFYLSPRVEAVAVWELGL